jgi:hypothetical protein
MLELCALRITMCLISLGKCNFRKAGIRRRRSDSRVPSMQLERVKVVGRRLPYRRGFRMISTSFGSPIKRFSILLLLLPIGKQPGESNSEGGALVHNNYHVLLRTFMHFQITASSQVPTSRKSTRDARSDPPRPSLISPLVLSNDIHSISSHKSPGSPPPQSKRNPQIGITILNQNQFRDPKQNGLYLGSLPRNSVCGNMVDASDPFNKRPPTAGSTRFIFSPP